MPTWTMIGAGLLAAAAPVGGTDSRLYLVSNGKLYVSSDGAATWEERVPSIPASSDLQWNTDGWGVFKGTSAADDVIYAPGIYSVPSNHYELFKSVDGGSSFTRQGPIMENEDFPMRDSIVTDPSTCYVVKNLQVVKTTDSGTSYTGLTRRFIQMSVSDNKLWGYDNGAATGGDTITTRSNLDGSSPENLVLESGGDMLFPARAWSDTGALAFGGPLNYPVNKLFKIIGTTATDITPPGPFATDCRVLDACTPDGDTIIAIISDDTNYLTSEVWRSGDGGSNWAKVLEGPNYMLVMSGSRQYQIRFDPQNPTTWYLWTSNDTAGENHLSKSLDNGETWEDLTSIDGVGELRIDASEKLEIVGG